MFDRAGERVLRLFRVVVDIARSEEQRFGGFTVCGPSYSALYEACSGSEFAGIQGHCLGLSSHRWPDREAACTQEIWTRAGLFSALVSPRRNPAGQIARAGEPAANL